MKGKIIASVILVLSIFGMENLYSQNYTFAVGPRIGKSNGISFKYILGELKGFEGIIHAQNGGIRVTGMLEGMQHFQKRSFTSGMHFIFGVGGHISKYNDYKRVTELGSEYINYMGFGVDVKLGLEYCMKAPITIGVEIKPFYEIATEENVETGFMDITVTLRHSIF